MDRTGKAERDAAFTAFVEQATPSLLRTAWLLTGDHHAAHDLVQAALVRTYVAWPRVRPETALAYARRILVNERTDRWRRHGAELTGRDTTRVGRRTRQRHRGPGRRGAAARHPARAAAQGRRAALLHRPVRAGHRRRTRTSPSGSVKSAASRGLATLRAQLVRTEGGVR